MASVIYYPKGAFAKQRLSDIKDKKRGKNKLVLKIWYELCDYLKIFK
ncbi:MAG: hypothetical protein NT084_10535 [Bacteroidetes bacterium]|nr:hypothetical protein [Bacteroidota bacterium]